MTFRLVSSGWAREMSKALVGGSDEVRVSSPFISSAGLSRLGAVDPRFLRVLTRFDLDDFVARVNDLAVIRYLVERGARVRGIQNLHAKLYVFGDGAAIVTSANLTKAGLESNHEFGCVVTQRRSVKQCSDYFDSLWALAGRNLRLKRVTEWEARVVAQRAALGKPNVLPLGDEGVDIGLESDEPHRSPIAPTGTQFFVKFVGRNDNRADLDTGTVAQIESSACHRVLGYPRDKRPRSVQDGATMFIGRLTDGPNDVRIFGRGIAHRYEPGRDDATATEIARRTWMERWPHFVRVTASEFLKGSMRDGVSLNDLMSALEARAFASTLRNALAKKGNTDPRRAYRQQPAVELTPEAAAWITRRLERAFKQCGVVSSSVLAEVD